MHSWTKTKPDYMDVAYTSERSIEDELDRASHSDVATILISYIIMFAYIAIALGQVRTWSRVLVIFLIYLYVFFALCNLNLNFFFLFFKG